MAQIGYMALGLSLAGIIAIALFLSLRGLLAICIIAFAQFPHEDIFCDNRCCEAKEVPKVYEP